jgi:hypothetical protein
MARHRQNIDDLVNQMVKQSDDAQKRAEIPVPVKHSLLMALHRLDEEAIRLFPTRFAPGFGRVGLILDRKLRDSGCLHRSRYTCAPVNCAEFADTGGDGTHFSMLIQDGGVTEQSPVFMTVPPDGQTLVVGESLFDFLCLGYYRGYFALQELMYKPDLTLEVYTNPDWQPSEKYHYSVGYAYDDEDHGKVLAFLRDKLSLQPWRSVAHFHELQERFGGLLVYP